jgi:hypothetical protein
MSQKPSSWWPIPRSRAQRPIVSGDLPTSRAAALTVRSLGSAGGAAFCVQASRQALDRGRQRCAVLDQLLDVGVGHPMQAVVRFVAGHQKPYLMSRAVWDKPAEAFL